MLCVVLGCQFFPSSLNMSSHCFLPPLFSMRNRLNFMEIPLCIMSSFSLLSLNTLIIYVSWFLALYPFWSLTSSMCRFMSFIKYGKFLGLISLNILSFPFSFFSDNCPLHICGAFYSVPQVSCLCSFFFI